MVNLIIVGTGAVAAEITSFMATAQYKWNDEDIQIKGYLEFDEYRYLHKQYKYTAPILGDINSYEVKSDDYFIIANATVSLKKQFAQKLQSNGAKFINLLHPTCIISPTAEIGIGNVLSAGCQIGPLARIGDFNILTSGSVISHDCVVGDFNSFSSVILCGHSIVGNSNSFYIRSTVIPHIKVGDNCTIQAGMMVDKDLPDGTIMYYRFKEKIIAIPKQD